MKTEEKIDRTPRDRSKWGSGPWDGEPDRVEGKHAGLPTLALRNPMGGWCGYVAVPPGHPFHGQPYDEHYDLDVHGGLTYSDRCDGSRICHIPKPGEPDDVWWFGFDCGHSSDLLPGMRDYGFGGTYRTLDYVRAEIQKLAEQLAQVMR